MKTSRSKSARTPRRPNSGISLEDEPEFESIISHGPNVYHLSKNEIGRGGFAVVFTAFNSHTGQTVAVKRPL